MSNEAAQLPEEFKDLPESERRQVRVEFVRLNLPYDSEPIEDEEIGKASRTLFERSIKRKTAPSRGECGSLISG